MRPTKGRKNPSEEKYEEIIAMMPLWLDCWHIVRVGDEESGRYALPRTIQKGEKGRNVPDRVK
jgi:hypothetical protein